MDAGCDIAAVPGQDDYAAIDAGQLVNGALYTYFIVATYGDGFRATSNLVTIVGVNEPPVAAERCYSVAEDASFNEAAPGVLANDADPDTPSTLTAALVTGPVHGTLTFAGTGSFTYTPAGTSRRGFVHLSGERRSRYDKRRDRQDHRDVDERQPDHQQHRRSHDRREYHHGPIACTVGDDDSTGVVVSATSSNTALVPAASLVIGGSGLNRTLTVTPAAGQSGSTTITVRVADSGGAAAIDTFVLTVRPAVLYTFVGVQNVPLSGKTFKTGSAVPMQWLFKQGSTVVDSSKVGHIVTVRGPMPSGVDPHLQRTRIRGAAVPLRCGLENLAIQPANEGRDRAGLSGRRIRRHDRADGPSYQSSPVLRLNLVKKSSQCRFRRTRRSRTYLAARRRASATSGSSVEAPRMAR